MEYKVTRKLMGSVFELIVHHPNAAEAEQYLNAGIAEIQRLETLLTEFSEDSDTARINRSAGKSSVAVDPEVYHLLERCIRLSTLTQGAFDITVGPLKKLYNFKQQTFEWPSEDTINAMLEKVGYEHIQLKDGRVMLEKEGMRLSFAAVGKGYAADRVKALWQQMGVTSGVINASGDLTLIGRKEDGKTWQIGIANPDNTEEMLFYLPAEHASVATSGDYEQFVLHNGIRYSHNIDPKTGRPLRGIRSVTVISPGAELSDALATAIYVLGVKKGLHLADQLPLTHCLIIDEQHEVFSSKNLNIEHAKH